jgi:hypothetical protein
MLQGFRGQASHIRIFPGGDECISLRDRYLSLEALIKIFFVGPGSILAFTARDASGSLETLLV